MRPKFPPASLERIEALLWGIIVLLAINLLW